MKIKLEPTAIQARRAVGDSNMVVRCRNGVFDMYPKPELPPSKTTEQMAVRAAWRAGVAAWSALSPEQKSAWAALAIEANAIYSRSSSERLTGYRLFQSSAKYRQILDLPILADPRGIVPPATVSKLDLLPSPDARTFRFRVHHETEAAADYRLIVSLSPATSGPGRKPDRRNGRHIKGYGAGSTVQLPASGGEVEITDARFAILPRQRFGVWVRIVHPESGTAGPEFFADLSRPETE